MTLTLLTGLIGGIGLFLPGMGLMTKGLRNAADPDLGGPARDRGHLRQCQRGQRLHLENAQVSC